MTNHGGLPKLITSIHNKSPYMFGNIKLDAKLYKRNRTQILLQQSVKNYEMAPSSTLDYAMPIGTRPLTLSSGEKSSTYNGTLRLVVKKRNRLIKT
ncbi:WxL protein host-binding domain-containing protein [Latilactobacillus curvatus]|uniref:WxL protein host-binding domain-containing protein n=1 Tax=Latilactobacillus curvatus TaxID=28038 RepID=UPI0035D09B61